MLSLNKRRFLIIFSIFIFVVAFILIILGINNGQADLEFSKLFASVINGKRISADYIARLFEIIGETPIYFAIIFILSGLMYLCKDIKNQKLAKVLIIFLGIFGALVGTYIAQVCFKYISTYLENGNEIGKLFNYTLAFKLPIGILISGLFYYLTFKLQPNRKGLINIIIIMVISLALAQGIVAVIKPLMSRNRFRAMCYLDNRDFAYFTPWYQKGVKRLDVINAIKDDFKSFPSGHTASAATLFIIALFPYYFEKCNSKKYRLITLLIPIIFTFLVAIYRVRAGAHYLSDVIAGGSITILSIYTVFYLNNCIIDKNS